MTCSVTPIRVGFFITLLKYSTSSEGLYKVNSIYVIKSFLDEHKIEYITKDINKKKTKEQIILEAERYTIPLKCD